MTAVVVVLCVVVPVAELDVVVPLLARAVVAVVEALLAGAAAKANDVADGGMGRTS